jgi:L-threonylcarbamoyladenylate synthase
MSQVSIESLVKGVLSGECIISFPTDTVPALAVRPDRGELIYITKQRCHDKPLILMGSQPEDLWPYVKGTAEEFQIWEEVVRNYWPGALTLVLPASQKVPVEMNPLDPPSIGIRVPNFPIAQQILADSGPLATTSANLSGQAPLETLAEIETQFPQVLTLGTSQWKIPKIKTKIPSTVAKWTGIDWVILRQGTVKLI